MEIVAETLKDDVEKITLVGRMDNAGTQQIDMRFTALTATRKSVILVDLAQVSFMASIGLRTLIVNARALLKRGGRMALVSPQPIVMEVLQTAGVDTLIPTYSDVPTALAGMDDPVA